MESRRDARYRLRLAEGFLREAEQDCELGRWRSVVDNSQLAVENAAKAVLASTQPVPRVHDPGRLLRQALAQGRFAEQVAQQVEELATCAELLGPDVHIQTDYGDETGGRTPWELFDESEAQEALALARRAAELARDLIGPDNGSAQTQTPREEDAA